MWCTTLPHVRVVVPASYGMAREMASLHRRRTPTHWYLRPALPPFHGLIEGIAVRDIHAGPTAAERRQGGYVRALPRRSKQAAERCFHKLGHRALLASRFTLELRHYGV